MKGKTTTNECKYIVWVRDDKGVKFICYAEDLNSETRVTEKKKEPRLDTSFSLGPIWQ